MLRDALKAAEQGTLVASERQTVGEFLTRWLQDVVRTRVAAGGRWQDQGFPFASGIGTPLGHSQVSLTLNTYSHVLPALQREAAAKIAPCLAISMQI